MDKKLKISFIIPFTGMTGGIAVVLEYKRQLTAMGHDVKIFYPLLPCWKLFGSLPWWKRLPSWMMGSLRNIIKLGRSIPLFSEEIPVIPILRIGNISIPDADAVIATAWATAYDVNRLSKEKGRKYYFVQHYEAWSGSAKLVDGSYRLPLDIITIAPWLTELMREKFDRSGVTEIHNGIRLDKFYPPNKKNFDRASILLMAHTLEWKGTQDAIDALAIVKMRYPQTEIRMFGMYKSPNAPFDFEYYKDPTYEKLLTLYQNATIFISSSHKEGWHLPPMEAMACKCAVVATNVGCIPTLYNEKNLVIVETKNPSSIANGIITLIEDAVLTERTAEEGFKRIREQGWEKSAQKFHDCLSAQAL